MCRKMTTKRMRMTETVIVMMTVMMKTIMVVIVTVMKTLTHSFT